MNFSNLLDDLLLEHVRKIGDRYYIYSHKNPNKRLGKKEGYGSRGAAVHSMMMIASHGGFAKNKHKGAVIRNYEKRHGDLKEEVQHKCDMCGKVKPDVKRREDPYDKEINEKSVKKWFCDECYQERKDNI